MGRDFYHKPGDEKQAQQASVDLKLWQPETSETVAA
jgi:hypothetical protein